MKESRVPEIKIGRVLGNTSAATFIEQKNIKSNNDLKQSKLCKKLQNFPVHFFIIFVERVRYLPGPSHAEAHAAA